MKNPFKRKKDKFPMAPQQVIRTTEELTKEYQRLAAKAAESQYLVYVHTENLRGLNQQMAVINREAAERQKLDAAEPKKEGPNV